jgi:hypothetical protein
MNSKLEVWVDGPKQVMVRWKAPNRGAVLAQFEQAFMVAEKNRFRPMAWGSAPSRHGFQNPGRAQSVTLRLVYTGPTAMPKREAIIDMFAPALLIGEAIADGGLDTSGQSRPPAG